MKHLCHKVLQEEFLIIRKTARLLGKFTSSFPAVPFVPLHYRSLKRDKIFELKFAKRTMAERCNFYRLGKLTSYGG